MKFKEKLNQAAGFTLVELIVVIAILAILAGVAVPAYSGYINKANQQSDLTMISEIKDILTLGYYGGNLAESGHIILSTEGVVNAAEVSEGLAKVLADAYGSNWATTLKLKYGEWTVSPAFNLITAEAAAIVANSSFVTGSTPSTLMDSVSTLTNSIASSLGNKVNPVQSIKNNASEDAIKAVEEQLGVKIDDLKDDNTALSNFALLVVANEMSNMESIDDAENGSKLAVLVSGYATYSGYIYSGHATEDEVKAYDEMNAALADIANADLTDYENSTAKYATAQLNAFAEKIDEENLEKYAEGNMTTDVEAAMAMMSALNQGSSNLTVEDLSNSSLTTEGIVGEYFDQYINAAMVLAATGDVSVEAGQVAVCFSAENGIVIYTTVD